ncbi:hypothetical protein M0P98_08510 [bacterium]|jgi:hypothetical protein|nr:hypothetical protein [bacterium]
MSRVKVEGRPWRPSFILICNKKLITISFILSLLFISGLWARKYPEWFLYPDKYPDIVVGYNYRGSSAKDDAAANFCVFEHSMMMGDLYFYSETEKRSSDYYYYYDKSRFELVRDSLICLDTYILNTLTMDIIRAYGFSDTELSSAVLSVEALPIPDWADKNAYESGNYIFGVGAYTSAGNDVDAWKTAEERSIYSMLMFYSTRFTGTKYLFKEYDTDIYLRSQVIHGHYELKNISIIERYHDMDQNMVYVLSKINKSNIRTAQKK